MYLLFSLCTCTPLIYLHRLRMRLFTYSNRFISMEVVNPYIYVDVISNECTLLFSALFGQGMNTAACLKIFLDGNAKQKGVILFF